MSLETSLCHWYTKLASPAAPTVPFSRPSRPASSLTVALVTTTGVRLATQPPFDTKNGDHSFREIPSTAELADLVPDHTHYDTSAAKADIECVFPLGILRDLASQGHLGSVAPVHFGFMGYIPNPAPLQTESIPALVERLGDLEVGAVILSPG